MKEPYQLSPGQPSETVNLAFPAAAVAILNPTVNTVLVRVGGQDIPQTVESASFWVPPNTFVAYPVSGTVFGLGLGPAGLPTPELDDGYPTTVFVTFVSYGESMPQFGAMQLGAAPSASILKVQGDRAAGSYNDFIDLPIGVRTLALARVGSNLSYFTINGVSSGAVYFSLITPAGYAHHGSNAIPSALCRVDRELDSRIYIATAPTAGTDNGYVLLGFQERLAPGVYQLDMRQMVDVVPPGSTALPVNPPVAVRTQPLPLATRSGTTLAAIFSTYPYARINLIIRITGYPGGGAGLGVRLDARDVAGNIGSILLPSAADAANAAGLWMFQFGPGLPSAGRVNNLMRTVNGQLPFELVVYIQALDGLAYSYECYLEKMP